MLQPRMPQENRPTGDRRRASVASRLDPVRQNSVLGAMQRRHAVHHQGVTADALYARAHREQAYCEIADLRFPRRVRQHRSAIRQRRRHQQVFRGANGHKWKNNLRPAQPPVHAAGDVTPLQVEAGAHLLQPLDVQVHRPSPDLAAPRQGHPGLPHARHQRAEHEEGGAHLPNNIVGGLGVGNRPAQRQHPPGVALLFHRDAVLGQQFAHRLDVRQLRHVGQHEPLVGQQPGGHQR